MSKRFVVDVFAYGPNVIMDTVNKTWREGDVSVPRIIFESFDLHHCLEGARLFNELDDAVSSGEKPKSELDYNIELAKSRCSIP
jgi:hypothetical protein